MIYRRAPRLVPRPGPCSGFLGTDALEGEEADLSVGAHPGDEKLLPDSLGYPHAARHFDPRGDVRCGSGLHQVPGMGMLGAPRVRAEMGPVLEPGLHDERASP